jgi:hypothetical protein
MRLFGVNARFGWMAVAAMLAAAGCGDPARIDGDGGTFRPDAGPDTPDTGPGFRDGGGIGRTDLSLARVVPDHGPFLGGNSVVLRGSGFTDESQVTFGPHAVQPADHRLIDPRRLAVVVPAGEVGTVDVTITVGGDTVTLEDGYTYDAIAVEPDSGAVSGGTYVTIVGMGTSFAEGDRVLFGRSPCEDVEVVSTTRINCRTPPMSAGTVDVTVESGATPITAPDAFTYFDSSDPFTGGLGGGPVSGSINLTVLDGTTGAPVPDAYAVIGEDLATEHQGLTDSLGQVTFSGPDIGAPLTIHVAKFCYERTSVVSFDARDVTVFLIPWMDPMCGMGSPPPGGGRGRNGAFVQGELVWFRDFGLGPQEWFNVPAAREGWVRVAYVYTTQAAVSFPNPDPALGGTVQRVLEEPVGERGYPYSIFARPAGLAVYALAGLEETATGRFIPYVMGLTRNVLAGPGETVPDVDIIMDIPLDHYLEVELADLPSPVGTNPDRYRLQANIDLAGEGVIVRQVNGVDLDILRGRDASRPFRFTGQPALFGTLSDGRYRVEAGWFTGDFDGQPYTVAVERGITSVDSSVRVGGFLGIPQPTAPRNGDRLPVDRVFRWTADGPDPSLHVVVIIGADGNPAWRMFVPGDVREAPAPDLSTIPGLQDMPPGFITWAVFSITIPGFDFNEFRYADLNDFYWTRWAVDFYTAQR